MTENGLKDRVIGVACDGTGYGVDGTIWGCEFLLADWKDFERQGHLLNIPMPGGALAIQRPYRMALGYLYWLFPDRFEALRQEFFGKTDSEEARLIGLQIDKDVNSPLTSSCGRLFDVASALLGVRLLSEYEGQAACELEMVADEKTEESYPFDIKEDESGMVVDPTLIISAIMDEVRKGRNRDLIAGAFHNTVAEFITETCRRLRRDSRIDRVVLSGGVFQNVLLVSKLKGKLEREGFQVFTHKLVPTNDGGISLGQAVVANAKLGIAR
jgi:hydrogenase maturation protein HypF